jgi:hypothetical protein
MAGTCENNVSVPCFTLVAFELFKFDVLFPILYTSSNFVTITFLLLCSHAKDGPVS